MFTRWFIIYITTCYSLLTTCSLTWAEVGSSGWVILRKHLPVKNISIATVTVKNYEFTAALYNPALAAMYKTRQLGFVYDQGGNEDTLTSLLVSLPLKTGILTAGMVYYDLGTIKLNYYDDNNVLQSETVSAEQDNLYLLSYAVRIRNNLAVGINFKYVTSMIAERITGSAYAGDVGFFYLPVKNVPVTFAVQNLGYTARFKTDPLPTTIFVGMGYLFKFNKIYIHPGLSLGYNINDTKLNPAVGFEITYGIISFNAGYLFNVSETNLHVGIVINHKTVSFGYAYLPGKYFNPTNRVNLSFKLNNS